MTSLNDSAMRNIIGTLLLLLLLSGHAASVLNVFSRLGSMGVGVLMDTWGCGMQRPCGEDIACRTAAELLLWLTVSAGYD
jgi:hypothetical protein